MKSFCLCVILVLVMTSGSSGISSLEFTTLLSDVGLTAHPNTFSTTKLASAVSNLISNKMKDIMNFAKNTGEELQNAVSAIGKALPTSINENFKTVMFSIDHYLPSQLLKNFMKYMYGEDYDINKKNLNLLQRFMKEEDKIKHNYVIDTYYTNFNGDYKKFLDSGKDKLINFTAREIQDVENIKYRRKVLRRKPYPFSEYKLPFNELLEDESSGEFTNMDFEETVSNQNETSEDEHNRLELDSINNTSNSEDSSGQYENETRKIRKVDQIELETILAEENSDCPDDGVRLLTCAGDAMFDAFMEGPLRSATEFLFQ